MSDRITRIEGMCGGQPCIRGMRIRIIDICSMIVQGVTSKQILEDFPDLEPEDIEACLDFDWINEP